MLTRAQRRTYQIEGFRAGKASLPMGLITSYAELRDRHAGSFRPRISLTEGGVPWRHPGLLSRVQHVLPCKAGVGGQARQVRTRAHPEDSGGGDPCLPARTRNAAAGKRASGHERGKGEAFPLQNALACEDKEALNHGGYRLRSAGFAVQSPADRTARAGWCRLCRLIHILAPPFGPTGSPCRRTSQNSACG